MNNDAKEAALGLLSLAPPPPPQVIPQKRKQSAVATPTIPPPPNPAAGDVSSESINCVCGLDFDDGFSIACDDCGRWCHAACFNVDQSAVPEEWRCWECVPQVVDREKAAKIQRARLKQVEDLKDVEKIRRKQSPGVERKPRKQSALNGEGGANSRRKRRPSMVQTPHNTNANHNHHPNGHHNEDEHVDIDEPYTQSYVHINEDNVPLKDTRDKLRRQAQHWRGVTAVASQAPYEVTPVVLPPNHSVPPSTIQQLPTHSVNHPALSTYTNHSVRPPSYSFHTAAPVPSDHYITPFTSTITPTSAYLADPLNSYAHLGMPKPFVHLVGPPLDVALDARLSGNKGRFMRSGCKPNAVLRPVLCPRPNSPHIDAIGDRSDETLTFGVFALRDLKANEEVVLGWEWDDGNAVHSLPALIESPHMFPSLSPRPPPNSSPDPNESSSQVKYLRQQMSNILHALSSTFTTCACGSRAKDCVLTQMAAFVDGDGPVAGPSTMNGRVDLGPLVGAKRGFKTRERVPFSGGLAGMEMCGDDESSDCMKNANEKGKSAKAKGKERAVVIDEEPHVEAYIKFPSQRRITIDTTPRSPRRRRPPEEEMEVDEEDLEQKMPPKMRKRWIQREVQVLRVASTSSGASPESALTPEPESGGGAAGRDDDDRTETDDDHEMPPPPMPAALDPTTVSSIISRKRTQRSTSPPNTQRIPSGPHISSPSFSFSNLSLLSPVLPNPTSPQPLSTSLDPPTTIRNPPFPKSMEPLESPPSPTRLLPNTHIGGEHRSSSPKDGYFASRSNQSQSQTQDATGSPAPPESATSSVATPPPLTPAIPHSPPRTVTREIDVDVVVEAEVVVNDPQVDERRDVETETEMGSLGRPSTPPMVSLSEHHTPPPTNADEDVEMAPPSTPPPQEPLSLSNDDETLSPGEAIAVPLPSTEHTKPPPPTANADVPMDEGEDGEAERVHPAVEPPPRSPAPVATPSPAQPPPSPLPTHRDPSPTVVVEPHQHPQGPPSEAASTPEPTSSPLTQTSETLSHNAFEPHSTQSTSALGTQGPPTKVRMSLRDFSLRKKRQKEEEMAKAAAGGGTISTSTMNGVGDGLNGLGDGTAKVEFKEVDAVTPPPPMPPLLPKVQTTLEPMKERGTGMTTTTTNPRFSLARLLNSPTNAFAPPLRPPAKEDMVENLGIQKPVVEERNAMDVDLTVQSRSSNLTTTRPPQRPPMVQTKSINGYALSNILAPSLSVPVNGHQPQPTLITHEAKVELVDTQIPKEPPFKPRSVDMTLNGVKPTSHPLLMQSPSTTPSSSSSSTSSSLPSSALPSRVPSQNSFRDHLRRVSQEDGEMHHVNGDTSPSTRTTPTPGVMPSMSTYIPRSHTPPTQPRSFLSSRTSTTPSPSGLPTAIQSRRPSLPFRLGMVPPYPTTGSSTALGTSASPPPTPSTTLSNGPPSGPASRPLPNAPRALRNGSGGYVNNAQGHRAPPRGPLAERDRGEWERERWSTMPSRPRTRGGANPSWGR